MNGLQLFAFIALPLIVASTGWVVAFLVAPPRGSKTPALSKPDRHHA